jgi:hypothetical protein
METKEENKPQESEEVGSLESTEVQTTVVNDSADNGAAPADSDGKDDRNGKDGDKKKKKHRTAPGLAGRFNIYLLGFVLMILIAGLVSFVSYQKSKQNEKNEASVTTEPLSQEALDKLRQTDVKVGDPKQILSVESNAIFAGKVLIRDSLEVAGQIKVGGPLNLPGISVSGSSTFDQVQMNNVQVSGSAIVQGQLSVQNNVAVSGSLTVGGTLSAGRLNIETLQINQDVQFSRHIDAGGGTPGKVDGSALGAGGTSSVSGTDTAGTININTGGGTSPGCFVTISFAQRFNAVPHIVITPVGAAAAGINYYINRSQTSFSVCTTNAAPGGQNFAFDYVAID